MFWHGAKPPYLWWFGQSTPGHWLNRWLGFELALLRSNHAQEHDLRLFRSANIPPADLYRYLFPATVRIGGAHDVLATVLGLE